MRHAQQVCLAAAHLLDDRAHALFGNVRNHPLDRLANLAVDDLGQNSGGGNGELKAFPAHGFHKDGQVHFAAACHVESIGALLGDVQRDILQQFFFQTVTEVAGSNVFAFLAG